MNKRGFTLIELIAILGLLSIMVLIATPSLMNQIKSTNEKKYENFISDLCLASESYLGKNKELGESSTFKDKGNSVSFKLKELIDGGYISKNIKNPKTKEKINENDEIIVTITENMTYSCTLN